MMMIMMLVEKTEKLLKCEMKRVVGLSLLSDIIGFLRSLHYKQMISLLAILVLGSNQE
jgi:hypothetical protein